MLPGVDNNSVVRSQAMHSAALCRRRSRFHGLIKSLVMDAGLSPHAFLWEERRRRALTHFSCPEPLTHAGSRLAGLTNAVLGLNSVLRVFFYPVLGFTVSTQVTTPYFTDECLIA